MSDAPDAPCQARSGARGRGDAEYLELLDAIVRRERAEREGGERLVYPSVLERLGIGVSAWENAVRLTSRRFLRELETMADMVDEARRRK